MVPRLVSIVACLDMMRGSLSGGGRESYRVAAGIGSASPDGVSRPLAVRLLHSGPGPHAPLPLPDFAEFMSCFMFATGIENSYPTIALPDGTTKRVDEMEKCGHYKYWREDISLVKELGIEHLRYGPPYYRTHLAPGRYDWSFTDETFHLIRALGITPIVDLCHFGVPDWIGSFQNPEWPKLFAEYAHAFAQRYPWVRFYTPVNEIFIAATFSAQNGWWNERLSSDRAFVNALKHLCTANVLAMRAILRERGEAV